MLSHVGRLDICILQMGIYVNLFYFVSGSGRMCVSVRGRDARICISPVGRRVFYMLLFYFIPLGYLYDSCVPGEESARETDGERSKAT